MPCFTATQNYRSGLGQFTEGDQVELPEDFAAHINRDAPGTLVPCVVADEEASDEEASDEEASDERALDAPPSDRMVKGPQHKRGGG